MPSPARSTALLAVLCLLSACNTSQETAELQPQPRRPESVDTEGRVPEFCPKVALREGTAVLRKGAAPDLQYIASITQTSRECHVRDGQLLIKVGVAGRVVPGPAAKAGAVALPIRVAVTRGPDVLYSRKTAEPVTLSPGSGGGPFAYVDREVAVPEPQDRNLTIYVGFDEGKD